MLHAVVIAAHKCVKGLARVAPTRSSLHRLELVVLVCFPLADPLQVQVRDGWRENVHLFVETGRRYPVPTTPCMCTNIDSRSCSCATETSNLGPRIPTAQGADLRSVNCEGFTPLALCAYHGNVELFGHIVKCYQTLIWNYGAMHSLRSIFARVCACGHMFGTMMLHQRTKPQTGLRLLTPNTGRSCSLLPVALG